MALPKSSLVLFACMFLVWLVACGARTTLSGVWQSPERAATPIRSMLVIGIGTEETSRRQYEDHFSMALEERGTQAVPSYRVLPSEERLSQVDLAAAVARGGHDGVIVTRLLAVDTDERYVPPSSSMSVGVGRGYYGYYGSSFGVNYSPGYVQRTTIVRLETKLYEVGEDDLVWSAQSETFQPSSTEDIVESVTKAVVKRLAEAGWLAPR